MVLEVRLKVSVLVIYYYTQTSQNNIYHSRVSGGQESTHGLVSSSASRSLTSCSQGAAWACSHLKAQLSKDHLSKLSHVVVSKTHFIVGCWTEDHSSTLAAMLPGD